MTEYVFGVDLGGSATKIGLFETNGKLLDCREIPTRTEENGSYILGDIARALEEVTKRLGISKERIGGVGLGVPGPVADDGTVYRCVNLGWGVFNVERALFELTGWKVKATNDSNAAALGEMWQGAGAGESDVIMITLGTGIGSGVIINGQICAGVKGAGGEIGHIPVKDFSEENEICGCGKRGCLEQYASARGLERVAARYLDAHPDEETCLRDLERPDCKMIFEAAEKGDRVALYLVDEVCRVLGRALASVCCVVNTGMIIIGGGMSKAGDILRDGVEKYFKMYAFHASADTRIVLARLGGMAGIYGGARMVL